MTKLRVGVYISLRKNVNVKRKYLRQALVMRVFQVRGEKDRQS